MQQIADWLEKLGMSEYAQRFAESDIDTSVLRDLTDQDLKELGVFTRASAEDAACDCRACRCRSDLPAARVYGADDPRRRRALSGHGDVLGPGWLDGAIGAHGPRRPPRGHYGLPEVRRRDRATLRRLRCEVHGRWGPCLLWVSPSPRGRRRAGRARRAGVGCCSGCPEDPRAPCRPVSASQRVWWLSAT